MNGPTDPYEAAESLRRMSRWDRELNTLPAHSRERQDAEEIMFQTRRIADRMNRQGPREHSFRVENVGWDHDERCFVVILQFPSDRYVFPIPPSIVQHAARRPLEDYLDWHCNYAASQWRNRIRYGMDLATRYERDVAPMLKRLDDLSKQTIECSTCGFVYPFGNLGDTCPQCVKREKDEKEFKSKHGRGRRHLGE